MPVALASDSSISPSQGAGGTSTKFQCPSCGKCFLRRENLSRHLKTHDSVKPHKCAICMKEFTRSDLRQRHEATHLNGVNRSRSTAGRPNARPIDEKGSRVISKDVLGSHAVQEYGQQSISLRDGVSSMVGIEAFGESNVEANFQSAASLARSSSYSNHGMHPLQYPAVLPAQLEQVHGQVVDEPSIGDDVTFLWSQGDEMPLMNAWFDDSFYSALQETEPERGNLGREDSVSFLSSTVHHPLFRGPFPLCSIPYPSRDQGDAIYPSVSGRVSRASSPPNEASVEDRVAFAWNPQANQILTAEPIDIPHEHRLFHNHDSTYDISGECYEKVNSFLKQSNFYRSDKHYLVMPQLQVANIFIGLFFRHFEPQMPVIHRASLESTSQLPEPLIAIMIVIGAIYSGEKHTRRFAIVLLDLTRMSLQRALELDNTLMREPMVIYATALVCHTGLWCGNKRAFELAEALRGVVVTYCRRNYFTGSSPIEKGGRDKDVQTTLIQVWKSWASDELRKRLCWVVYGLDCQFPSVLYLPSTISVTELAKVECPCDEEFWQATTARKWKRLLGPASVPPSKTFVSAVGPFLGPRDIESRIRVRTMPGESGSTRGPSNSDCSHPKSLNSWTRFLVLMTIHVAIYEFTQQLQLARGANHDESDSEEDSSGETQVQDGDLSLEGRLPSSVTSDRSWEGVLGSYSNRRGHSINETIYIEEVFGELARRKAHLQDSLALFADTYLDSPADSALFQTSKHFQHSGEMMHRLGVVLLEVSVSDLQDSLGKSGGDKTKQAMSNVSRWVNRQPNKARQVALDAIRLISSLTPVNSPSTIEERRQDTGPYEIISFFLSVVLTWAFVTVAQPESKFQLLRDLRNATEVKDGPFFPTIEKALVTQGDDVDSSLTSSSQDDPGEHNARIAPTSNRGGDARVIFRSAAEVLTRLGMWGASLNLALLLHQRAKM